MCVYEAEQYIASGLVAALFSLIVFLNILGVRMFFAAPINRRALIAATLGVAGVILLFWRDFEYSHGATLRGIAFTLAAAVLWLLAATFWPCATSAAVSHSCPGSPGAWRYGALAIALVAAGEGKTWIFDARVPYVASLLYLAVFGSVVAFGAYLTMLGRIGAARAGYVGVAVPVVALLLSTVFEHYQWTPLPLAGAALCVIGNVLVLMPWRIAEPV